MSWCSVKWEGLGGTTALTSGDIFFLPHDQQMRLEWKCFHTGDMSMQYPAHILSERLMFLDVKLGCGVVRFASVCMPHMGYTHHGFQEVADQLHLALDGACRVGMQIVLRGNFNTQ